MGINKKKLPYAVVTITHLTDLLIFCHCRSREQSCRAHDGDHDGTTCRGSIGLYAELWPCKVLVCCFQLPVVGTHEADSGRPAAGWLDVGVCGTDDKRGGLPLMSLSASSKIACSPQADSTGRSHLDPPARQPPCTIYL